MSDQMGERDSLRYFCESLKKSASCAREMADLMESPEWKNTADMLDAMRENGVALSKMRSMTAMEVEQALNLKTGAGILK